MIAMTCDAAAFTNGMRNSRLAHLTLRCMLRPLCPHCQRSVVTIGSRAYGAFQIRYLGCRKCHYRVNGPPEVIDADLKGHRSINFERNKSGRFVSTR